MREASSPRPDTVTEVQRNSARTSAKLMVCAFPQTPVLPGFCFFKGGQRV